MTEQEQAPTELVGHLHKVLVELAQNPAPETPNPPGVNKRASVALIIRVQPSYHHWPSLENSTPSWNPAALPSPTAQSELDNFFSQEWVQYGTPEIIFIKRASRVGDKWTGHVAFPGGRRDPEDASDVAAAVRETEEEVGIELNESNCIHVGGLNQHVVTSTWAKKAYVSYGFLPRYVFSRMSDLRSIENRLMVLCPYVFLVTTPSLPPLRLQPTEVASAHWVSMRALLSPSLRTVEYQDVSGRMARMGVPQWFVRGVVGRMMFAAVKLLPSESSYCSTIPGFVPDDPVDAELAKVNARHTSLVSKIWTAIIPWQQQQQRTPELILWGLTLGIVSDFLDLLPPYNSMRFWIYPTFTSPDMRWILSLFSYRVRKRKEKELGRDGDMIPVDTMTAAVKTGRVEPRSLVAGDVLEDYFACIRPSWMLTLLGRTLLGLVFAKLIHRRFLNRQAR